MLELLHLPSDYVELKHLKAELRRVVDLQRFTAEAAFDIMLSVHEAVVNAMSHGNRLARERAVTVEWQYEADGLRITVRDEGGGFDYGRWLELIAERTPGPEMDHGRGILLMTRLMDRVAFADGGATVILTRRFDRTPSPS